MRNDRVEQMIKSIELFNTLFCKEMEIKRKWEIKNIEFLILM